MKDSQERLLDMLSAFSDQMDGVYPDSEVDAVSDLYQKVGMKEMSDKDVADFLIYDLYPFLLTGKLV